MKDESTSKKNKKIIAILVSFGFITAIIGGVAIFALSSNMPIQSDFSEANNQIHDVVSSYSRIESSRSPKSYYFDKSETLTTRAKEDADRMKSAQDNLNEALNNMKTSNVIENDKEAKQSYEKISDKLDGFNKEYTEIINIYIRISNGEDVGKDADFITEGFTLDNDLRKDINTLSSYLANKAADENGEIEEIEYPAF